MTTTAQTLEPSCSPTLKSGIDQDSNDVTGCLDPEERAARTIQKVYRGYRARRELQGLRLAVSARRLEPTTKSQWNQSNLPERPLQTTDEESTSPARKNWQRAVSVAIQAGVDDDCVEETDRIAENDPGHHSELIRETPPKMMDLQYFLEMVDVKHRHGSNLRAYHTVWKNSPSSENFFYWLDHGEGKRVDLPQRPRERLEKEQVRYLSPEERFNYLVKVDEAGLFRWTKNNELVDTDDKRFKDSVHGVVHAGDDAPRFKGYSEEGTIVPELQSTSARSLPSQQVVADEDDEESELSMTEEYDLQEAPEKPARITPAAMYDRSAANVSFKKGTWLFVADTSYRIYIGIKEPGAFQHSSFLRGGRIAAAGMLRIRNGQLRSLAPLSGHYRPHVANFRAFHHSLQDRGVDLSRVSISKSYAMIAGIEGYALTKRKMHAVHEKLDTAKDKLHLTLSHAAESQDCK